MKAALTTVLIVTWAVHTQHHSLDSRILASLLQILDQDVAEDTVMFTMTTPGFTICRLTGLNGPYITSFLSTRSMTTTALLAFGH